jgi:hypothetical protein
MSRSLPRGLFNPNKQRLPTLEVLGQTQLGDEVTTAKKLIMGDGTKKMSFEVNDESGFMIKLTNEEDPQDVFLNVQNSAGESVNIIEDDGLGTVAQENISFFLPIDENLSGLSDVDEARNNLGLGSASTQNLTSFLRPSHNLSDVDDVSTSRNFLSLGTASTRNSTEFLQVDQNLDDLPNVSTARTNLGLGSSALHDDDEYLPSETDTFESLTVADLAVTSTFYAPINTTEEKEELVVTEGAMVFDTDLNEVTMFNGTTWKTLYSDVPSTFIDFGVALFAHMTTSEVTIPSSTDTKIVWDAIRVLGSGIIALSEGTFTSIGSRTFYVICQVNFINTTLDGLAASVTIRGSNGMTPLGNSFYLRPQDSGGGMVTGIISRENNENFEVVCNVVDAAGASNVKMVNTNAQMSTYVPEFANLGSGVMNYILVFLVPQ